MRENILLLVVITVISLVSYSIGVYEHDHIVEINTKKNYIIHKNTCTIISDTAYSVHIIKYRDEYYTVDNQVFK
jgi:hypothetical protein